MSLCLARKTISWVRDLNIKLLRELPAPVLITRAGGEALAVLVPYDMFIKMQEIILNSPEGHVVHGYNPLRELVDKVNVSKDGKLT